jgi:hypothetical protein
MSDDPVQLVRERLRQAGRLEHGPSQVAVVEEAVRIADAHGDVALAYEARERLVNVATFSGAPEKVLVAFSWLLGQSDRDPQRFPDSALLWSYKWAANDLKDFPQISREQAQSTFADMARRFERNGASQRPVHKLRCTYALLAGELEAARAHYRDWIEAKRDSLSDCVACDQDDQVRFLVAEGKDAEAIERAAPILAGRMRCAEIPHHTLAHVLLPLLRLGRVDEAARHYLKGSRLVARNPDFLRANASNLRFLALTDNFAQAKALFERKLTWALETHNLAARFEFLLAARLLVGRLERTGPREWRLPRELAGRELVPWLDDELGSIAARFDERNGNAHHRGLVAGNPGLEKLAKSHPLADASPDA